MTTSFMQRATRFAALGLLASLAFAASFAIAQPDCAYAARDFGQLCSKYESGNDPAQIDPNSAYGAYQMSPGNAYTFAKELKAKEVKASSDEQLATYATWGKALVNAYKSDGKETGTSFDKAWKSCAKQDESLFFDAQYNYCKEHYYKEALKYIAIAIPDLDLSKYTAALKNTIFSTAIQHGPYGCVYYIMQPALEEVGGYTSGLAESVLIDLIYYERSRTQKKAPADSATQISTSDATAKSYGIAGKYLSHFYSCSSAVQVSVYNRLHNSERKDAQELLVKKGVTCKHTKTKGGKAVYSAQTDATHTVKTTKTTCASCGAVLSGATKKKNVAHAWIYKDAKWHCECGHNGVVHSVRCYVATSKIKVLAKTKDSAKTVATMTKGGVYKPSKVALKNDGLYWGKFTVNGKTGYVKMSLLSSHGSACSSSHEFVNDICTLCDIPRKLASGLKAGTYQLASKTTMRKAAYTASSKVQKIAAGKKVKVKKLVKNSYGEYFAKATYNNKSGYIAISAFV